jgi:DNA-binding transcriptional LysR family regulator
MMEFELLRSFVAVAECGGFHRAAAFRFARRSAHCASRKRIGLADRLHEPQSYGVRAAALAGLAITPLPASAIVAGLCVLGVESGLPVLPALEFAIFERKRPDAAAAALTAVLVSLGQTAIRPTAG